MKKLRFWLIKKLFKEDEKYIVYCAISDRITQLERLRVVDKNIDADNAKKDINDLGEINDKIFITDLI